MTTDIILDQGNEDTIELSARVVKINGSDLIIDYNLRRKNNSPFRRALVHDQNDGLTINWNSDYPGGVSINKVAHIYPINDSLVIHGGISYEVNGLALDRHGGVRPSRITVSLDEELGKLRNEISQLNTKIAALNSSTENLQVLIAQLMELSDIVAIPSWQTLSEVEEGDEMGLILPSAEQLGLVVEFRIDQRNPNFQHEEIISITPQAGSLVKRGSKVVIDINLEG